MSQDTICVCPDPDCDAGGADALRKILDWMGERLAPLGLAENDHYHLCLATQEAVANAMEHGNRNQPDKRVTVTCTIDGRKIEVMVKDEGHGFDHEHLPDPTTEENLLCEHGRGVFLIRQLMDGTCYNACGNQITFVKYRSES